MKIIIELKQEKADFLNISIEEIFKSVKDNLQEVIVNKIKVFNKVPLSIVFVEEQKNLVVIQKIAKNEKIYFDMLGCSQEKLIESIEKKLKEIAYKKIIFFR